MNTISVLVAVITDEPILSQGLESILQAEADFSLRPFPPALECLPEILCALKPSIVLLDLGSAIPEQMVLQIRQLAPDSRLLFWAHDVTSELASQAWELGAAGILLKTSPCDLVVRCLGKVAAGEFWFERSVMNSLADAKPLRLTRRESDLVYLVSQGLSNKEIASSLFLTEGSVKVYLSKLYRKAGVKDRYELGLYGLRLYASGLLPKTEPALTPKRPAGIAGGLTKTMVV
jgi:DNA-binding NarL/FixJ family response regulator